MADEHTTGSAAGQGTADVPGTITASNSAAVLIAEITDLRAELAGAKSKIFDIGTELACTRAARDAAVKVAYELEAERDKARADMKTLKMDRDSWKSLVCSVQVELARAKAEAAKYKDLYESRSAELNERLERNLSREKDGTST
jgi:cob(I)alamin adenosyltransferase